MIERYEIREKQVGEHVVVEALLYDKSEQRTGGPPPPILIPREYGVTMGGIPFYRSVGSPNALFRFFGDTFEKRIERARRSVTAEAEREMAKERRAARALSGWDT